LALGSDNDNDSDEVDCNGDEIFAGSSNLEFNQIVLFQRPGLLG